jgi:hypothetical protein
VSEFSSHSEDGATAPSFPLFPQIATRTQRAILRQNKDGKIFSTFPHRSSQQQGAKSFLVQTILP